MWTRVIDARRKTLEDLLKLMSGDRTVQWKSVLLMPSSNVPSGYLEGNLEPGDAGVVRNGLEGGVWRTAYEAPRLYRLDFHEPFGSSGSLGVYQWALWKGYGGNPPSIRSLAKIFHHCIANVSNW